jgi:citrate lyase beta subunit/acyl dehydratase
LPLDSPDASARAGELLEALRSRSRLTSLCVPGDRPERHPKALTSGCDEVVLDLEDAVADERKAFAREAVLNTLSGPDWTNATVAVRVNAGSAADLEALATCTGRTGLTVVLPKVEHPDQVRTAACKLAGTGIGIQALIETPLGSTAAETIAAADPSLVALIIGYADLGAELGRPGFESSPSQWLVHQERVLGAARIHGLQALDGPFLHLSDEAGLVESSRIAHSIGFDGKWAIHPRQLESIMSMFERGIDAELSDAVSDALAGASGVAVVDGLMVDDAHLRKLQRPARQLRSTPTSVAETRPPRHTDVHAPFADDLQLGDEFAAPGVTIDAGLQVMHRAICGDRLPLALDAALAERVTGTPALLAHPSLVADVIIGQSTEPSGRVLGNLFYRGMVLAPVFLGSTLRTSTKVVAIQPTRDGTKAKVTLAATAVDASGRQVASYLRCPLLPSRNPVEPAGEAPAVSEEIRVPSWDLDAHPKGEHLTAGDSFSVAAAETVTSAPELARATLNLAMTHTDAQAGAYDRRLVYGGHVISIALAHACRALPGLVTILAWRSCDHLGPVFEGDRLTTRIDVVSVSMPTVELRIRVTNDEREVLDWHTVALYAA